MADELRSKLRRSKEADANLQFTARALERVLMTELLKDGHIPSGSEFFLWMLLSTMAATVNSLAPNSALAGDPTSAPASSDISAQGPQDENRQADPSASPAPV